MLRRRIGLTALILIVFVLVGGDLIWTFYGHPGEVSGWRNPPIYEGAQQIKVQEFGKFGKYLRAGLFIVKIITFTVPDEEKRVTSFYFDTFRGWSWHQSEEKFDPKSDSISYSSFNPGPRPSSIYYLDVDANPLSSGSTQVQIAVMLSPGY